MLEKIEGTSSNTTKTCQQNTHLITHIPYRFTKKQVTPKKKSHPSYNALPANSAGDLFGMVKM